MPALLILAPAAADSGSVLAMARIGVALNASPIVVALPPILDAPPGSRIVRIKPGSTPIAAIRLGMAQLANTTATSVLLWPHAAADMRVESLRTLLDAAEREPASMIAFADSALDLTPVIVPRDAWLEVVTLGEGGLDAVARRRRVARVEPAGPSTT